jgi:hypothetical protein
MIAAITPPAGGAPLDQVIIASVVGMLLTVGLIIVGLRYRAGGMRHLDALAAPFSRLLGVPSWAALPSAVATLGVGLAGFGVYWDVSVHIDRGRDPGPFGTPAHYPILVGLFLVFAAGWLALVMARGDDARKTGIRLTDSWTVPTTGLMMMASGAFALLGFPLDDLWHNTFGQDVTEWGPTHLIMITGAELMIPMVLMLLREGRVAIAKEPSGLAAKLLPVAGATGLLAALTIYQMEFGYGVEQYNLLFQPALIAFTAGVSLVFARIAAGRGGALAAALLNVALSGAFLVFVHLMGQATVHFPIYVGAALGVELVALVVNPRKLLAFTGAAVVATATLGTVAEWGWTHVWVPIPWPAHFVPSAIAISFAAAAAGALVGAFLARVLSGEAPPIGRHSWIGGAVGAIGLAAVVAICLPTHVPAGSGATISLAKFSTKAGTRYADATVTFVPASIASAPDYVEQLSWQGHAKSVVAVMRRVGPGVYASTKPIPISGSWKSLIRMQQGRTRADVSVFMPADPAIPATEIPARAHVTRALISDTAVMQRERKKDVPKWLWNSATTVVLAIVALLIAMIGWGLNRVGRLIAGGTPPRTRAGRRRAPARGGLGVGFGR